MNETALSALRRLSDEADQVASEILSASESAPSAERLAEAARAMGYSLGLRVARDIFLTSCPGDA